MPSRDSATRKLLSARIRAEFAKKTPAQATLAMLREIHTRQMLANAAVSDPQQLTSPATPSAPMERENM